MMISDGHLLMNHFPQNKSQGVYATVRRKPESNGFIKNNKDMGDHQELQLYLCDRSDDYESALEFTISCYLITKFLYYHGF